MKKRNRRFLNKGLSFMLALALVLTGMIFLGEPITAEARDKPSGTIVWKSAGEAGFTSAEVVTPNLAIDDDGRLYIAYQDSSLGKLSVMKYDETGWQSVGAPGISESHATFSKIILDRNKNPYVVFKDGNDGSKAAVMKYNGTNWEKVGNSSVSTSRAEHISLALDSSDTPYVAYMDSGNENKMTVSKYNKETNTWSETWVSSTAGFCSSMDVDSADTPYLAYIGDDKAIVMKYNGTNWQEVGNDNIEADGNYIVTIKLDSTDTPYIAYGDVFDEDTTKPTVRKYDGTNWQIVGSSCFSEGDISDLSMNLDSNDTPYVAYTYKENVESPLKKGKTGGGGSESPDRKIIVKAYNGTEWKNIGSQVVSSKAYFQSNTLSITVDKNSKPYVMYKDPDNEGKATVRFPVIAFSVTYDGNGNTGGSVPADSSYYEETEEATVLGDTGSLVKDGALFKEWNTESDGSGTKYDAADLLTIGTSDVTLYAIYNSKSDPQPSAPEHSGGKSSGSNHSNKSNDTEIIVNGKTETNGDTTTTKEDNKTVTRVKLDDEKVNALLEKEGKNSVITIPVSKTDVAIGQLNGQTVKNMESRDSVLEIKTDAAAYTLPAAQINIDSVLKQLGQQIELKDILVNIKISEPDGDAVKLVEDNAEKGNYQLVVKPIDFEITCTNGTKTVGVAEFNGYVERRIALPEGVDPAKITTGVVINADGTVRHVPTQIIQVDGKYYAQINSLTNSNYTVIWNPITFTDVEHHWAKDAVNNMGSRMVVTGVGNGNYHPNSDVTRAEFAAIVVRALGLGTGTPEGQFRDVSPEKWFAGYVETASEYGMINGYDENTFAPNDKITREQAMAIIARTMKITGIEITMTDSEIGTLLGDYTDAALASGYAKSAIASCLKTGVISGTSSSTLAPKNNITRAEVAVIAERLLKKAELI